MRLGRDITLIVLGAIGFLHEVFTVGFERPFVISASLALLGVPFALALDRRRNGK